MDVSKPLDDSSTMAPGCLTPNGQEFAIVFAYNRNSPRPWLFRFVLPCRPPWWFQVVLAVEFDSSARKRVGGGDGAGERSKNEF